MEICVPAPPWTWRESPFGSMSSNFLVARERQGTELPPLPAYSANGISAKKRAG